MSGGRGRGRRRQIPPLERRYGYFRCTSCNRHWESAHVYCIKKTRKVFFKQECENCRRACNPYKVEVIKCGNCGLPANICKGKCGYDNDDEFEDDEDENGDENDSNASYNKHHVDPKKPHRADLCQKCQSGWKCV
ncbi:zygote arrest protein 1-like [Mizuhopecten yessoensis]|uniref:Zygote arrest protein 1 n=1 Tax=Mizuhopecten yessoensis TaxID=6573 RepID=A0A210QF70_MIZYE|nr:zygote arrest protein 1-like [Mizuhopecten yessoensis]OWF47378.1 Zygote arrest protein 1 [Mizuhopecten yessoensis]